MSTRATYTFKDENGVYTVYKHYDGYPSGGLMFIKNAIKYAWALPRFEADEFAASFIAANKHDDRGVCISKGSKTHSDTEYDYVITCKDGRIYVEIWQLCGEQKVVRGFLDDLMEHYND